MVHGVFFRASLAELADAEKVNGWVRNVTDGTVEALLEGEKDSVDKVVDWARRGPPSARVDSVQVAQIEVRNLKGFKILG